MQSRPRCVEGRNVSDTMPFGKYKGTPTHLVPVSYLQWMLREKVFPKLAQAELAKRGLVTPTAASPPASSTRFPVSSRGLVGPADGYQPGAGGSAERRIRTDGEHFVIECPPNPLVINDLRSLPGRWFHDTTCRCGKCKAPKKYWTVPISPDTLEPILAFADQWKFRTESASIDRARAQLAERAKMLAASVAVDADIGSILSRSGFEPRGYQRAGIHYMRLVQRCLLADEMGLGKTPQALLTLRLENAFPAIIVCPASLKLKWKDEIDEWCPRTLVQVIGGGNSRPRNDIPITIVNYDLLRVEGERQETRLVGVGELLAAIRPKAVVLDESHYCKNPKALRTRACHMIAKEAQFVYLLTGTPVLNRPEELISQLKIMRRLEDLGGYRHFVTRYCGARTKTVKGKRVLDASGSSNLNDLNKELRARCFVRRRKTDVMPDLPMIQRSIVSFDISNRAEYERAKRDLVEWLRSEGKNAEAAKAQFNETLTRINYLRRLAVRGKFEAVCGWLEEFLEAGEKLLIFGHHKDVIEGLAGRFRAKKIYGETPLAERKEINDRFQTDPKMQVLVLNLQSGGTGLNLTAASNVAFVEWAWTPGENDQAEARVYGRANDPHGANAWYMRASNTIEDDHLALLDLKRQIIEAAQDGGRPALSEREMVNAVIGRMLAQ